MPKFLDMIKNFAYRIFIIPGKDAFPIRFSSSASALKSCTFYIGYNELIPDRRNYDYVYETEIFDIKLPDFYDEPVRRVNILIESEKKTKLFVSCRFYGI